MNGVEAVKLVFLEIIDFKLIEPGKLEWKHHTGMDFDVVNQPGKHHSQIFEAFQFGFGCDTSAGKAGVIVTLQQNARMIHFSHSKSADSSQTYSIKVDGVDGDFRMVDREQYIDELVKLKVFASTMSFMLGNDLQFVLPENEHDLRQHLEKHLMNKPHVLNDYDDIDDNVQSLFEQKKSIQSTTMMVNDINRGIEAETENRRLKAEAGVGERDLKLLEAFKHSKRLEKLTRDQNDLRSKIDGASNVQTEQVVGQLKNWDAKMDSYPLRQLADETLKNCTSSISQQWRKEIETLQAKIQSMKLLRGTHPSVLNARLRTSRLKIQLDDARVKLKQAEIEEKISNISSEWDTKMRARRSAVKNYDKVSGRGFINMAAIASHSAVTQEKLLKKEFHGMDSGEDYDAEPYTFRIPSACKPDDVRPYLDRIPLKGVYLVKAPDLKTHQFISSLLKAAPYKLKERVIYMHSCDPNDKGPYPQLPLQVPVEAKKVLTTKPIRTDAATDELRKLTETIEKKEYIVGKKGENADNGQLERDDFNVVQFREDVDRLERELAAQYRTEFADLFQQIPTIDTNDPTAVVNWIETWKEFRNISQLDSKTFQTTIADLEAKLTAVEKREQHYRGLEQRQHALLSELQQEGQEIVEDVDSVALKVFGQLALSANTALADSLRETIDCIKVQLTKWGLTFNPDDGAGAQAFYDALAPQNKPTLESDDWTDVKSAIASKMHEIEEGLAVLQTEDHYNLCTADAMSAMKADFVKQQRKKAINMVKLVKPLNNRKEAFEPHFRKLEQHLHGLVNYIQPKWGVYLELSAGVDPLDEPIRLMVDDPQLHSALTRTMTLNHSIAALILQLAINIAIGSQFIIIDTLDAFVEPCLIDPILVLLKELIRQYGIQIISIKVKPEAEELAAHKHHTWAHQKNIIRIADTTSITTEEDVEMSGSGSGSGSGSSGAISSISFPTSNTSTGASSN